MKMQAINLLSRSEFWAILPEAFARLLNGTGSFEAKTFDVPKAKGPATEPYKIAVIPVQGVLTKNCDWCGTSYDSIAEAAEKAGADPAVKRVILAVDSPGGEVTGLPETAAILAQVAKLKSLSAIVDGTAASAAYWLASQASDITLTPSGEVGSVGIRMMHVDISKALDDAGLKVTELSSGKYKTEWSAFKPLSKDAAADMQKRLDVIHTDFINAVGQGRGTRARASIRAARYGEGRMFGATDALGHGLVDAVKSPRGFFQALSTAGNNTSLARTRLELERQRF